VLVARAVVATIVANVRAGMRVTPPEVPRPSRATAVV